MRAPSLAVVAAVAMLLGQAAPALAGSGAGQKPGAPPTTTYEFNDSDIQLLSAPLIESLLQSDVGTGGGGPATLAWLRLRNDTEDRRAPIKRLMESIEVNLIKAQRFKVLSRTALEAMAREQGLAATALYDPLAVRRVGGLAGVSLWLSGDLTETTSRESGVETAYYNLTVFITDNVTTDKLWGDTAELKKARKLQFVEKKIKTP